MYNLSKKWKQDGHWDDSGFAPAKLVPNVRLVLVGIQYTNGNKNKASLEYKAFNFDKIKT